MTRLGLMLGVLLSLCSGSVQAAGPFIITVQNDMVDSCEFWTKGMVNGQPGQWTPYFLNRKSQYRLTLDGDDHFTLVLRVQGAEIKCSSQPFRALAQYDPGAIVVLGAVVRTQHKQQVVWVWDRCRRVWYQAVVETPPELVRVGVNVEFRYRDGTRKTVMFPVP